MIKYIKIVIVLCLLLSTHLLNAQKTTSTFPTIGNIFSWIANGGQLNWNNNNSWTNGRPEDGDTAIIILPVRFNINTPTTLGKLIVFGGLEVSSNRILKTKYLELDGNIDAQGFFPFKQIK